MDPTSLYQTILTRKSARRYVPEVEAALLVQVQRACAAAEGLIPENQFKANVQALLPERNITSLLGAYGRLIAPPYVVVPTLQGSSHLLVDLGYRSQQIVIQLTQLGLGTCFVGTLLRDEKARELFLIGTAEHHAAVIAFGHPAQHFAGRMVNQITRAMSGASNKLPADQLYYDDLAAPPTAPPPNWAPIVEAGRAAPSALNAQPWRFLGEGNHLYLFTIRHSARYGRGRGAAFKFFDSGICLANLVLAARALGLAADCRLCDEPDDSVPEYPQELQPVAELILEA